MKRIAHFIALTAMAITLPVLGHAATWKLDPVHSEVEFKVKHMMVANVKGVFRDVKGALDMAELDPSTARVSVTIAAGSIDTGTAKRDEHLRGPDFFDIQKFPEVKFTSKKVARGADGLLSLTGDLSMHGVTREVTLQAEEPTKPQKDLWGNQRVGVTAAAKLNRSDYGLTWNAALEAGGVAVSDEVAIELNVVFVKDKEM